MDRCRDTGLLDVGFDAYVEVDSCWFDDGRIRCDENELRVTNSTFTGLGPAITTVWEVRGEIRGNTFRVASTGIDASKSRQTIENNVFEDCAIGIRVDESVIGPNVVRHCGTGIVASEWST